MVTINTTCFEKSQAVFKKNSYFKVDTHRFGGNPSFDGHYGGIPLLYDRELRALALDPSDSHTLVFGATGSKKTRAFVMPAIRALGCAGESMIINDSKGELFARMAGELREKGYDIVTINLRNPKTGNSWNPLHIPFQYYRAGDVDKAAELAKDIADTIMLADKSQKEPFWDYASSDVCTGLILLLMKLCKERNLTEGAVNISNLTRLRQTLYANGPGAVHTLLWKWASEDEIIADCLSGSVQAPQDTRNSILATFDQKIRTITIQPSLIDMLADNNIEIDKIGERKTAVFLITPDEKTTYHCLVSLFIAQSYQYLIYIATEQGGRVKNRINYILDEFSSLPAIGSDFPSMITAARSRNIRFSIICQSKAQLKYRYREEADTITGNCTNWIYMGSRELSLLKDLSALCGLGKDNKPNISVYDLQHLDKESNQALLLCGRMKPCLMNLLDIDQFPERGASSIEIDTPVRTQRIQVDFESEVKKLVPYDPATDRLSPDELSISGLLGKMSPGKRSSPVGFEPWKGLPEHTSDFKSIIKQDGDIPSVDVDRLWDDTPDSRSIIEQDGDISGVDVEKLWDGIPDSKSIVKQDGDIADVDVDKLLGEIPEE